MSVRQMKPAGLLRSAQRYPGQSIFGLPPFRTSEVDSVTGSFVKPPYARAQIIRYFDTGGMVVAAPAGPKHQQGRTLYGCFDNFQQRRNEIVQPRFRGR